MDAENVQDSTDDPERKSQPQQPIGGIPQSKGCSCGSNGDIAFPASLIYAIGRVQPRFPRISIEKEFAQATAREDATGLTDHGVLHKVLSRNEYRYLARAMCWVFSIGGIETYILVPRESEDIELLIEATRSRPRSTDVDVLIGRRGPLANPTMCNGLSVPLVVFDQLYSFDIDSLLKNIPRPEGPTPDAFLSSAEELYGKLMLMADNAGATDEHRALNYIAVRYDSVYHKIAEYHAKNNSLAAVECRPSRLSGTRRIVDVVFTYKNRATDFEERFLTRVDVTDVFPFLVTKLSPYFQQPFD